MAPRTRRTAVAASLLLLAGCVGSGTLEAGASAEVCNGFDDDGDGLVDGDPSGAPLRLDCSNACGEGSVECLDGEWQTCSAPQPRDEACNGVDDDCDGEVDEGCGCVHGETRECDTGAPGDCGRGLERCEDGLWSGCDQFYFTGDLEEACDGRDNDCDGEVDEGGGCPCDWVPRGGSVYLFCSEGETWEGARDFCASWGYGLVSIETGSENDFIAAAAIERVPRHAWWIGLSDAAVEGRFTWAASGLGAGFAGWYGEEPNDGGDGEDCATINYGTVGGWNDSSCGDVRSFVCETER